MKKKVLGLMMVLVMIVTLVAVPKIGVQAKTKTKTKGYLVLVQTENDKWKGYTNLDYVTWSGKVMVKASSTSKALGLTYKSKDNNSFSIGDGTKELTFTKGSCDYLYNDGTDTITKTAKYNAYSATISKKKVNLVHNTSMANLVYYQYFSGAKAQSYSLLGYKGVICYSKIAKITSLPSIGKVSNADELNDNDDSDNSGNDNNNTGNSGYDGTVTIGGVEIPKLDGFAESALSKDSWGADDYNDGNNNNDVLYDAVQKFSTYVHDAVLALHDESNESGLGIGVFMENNVIKVIENGDATNSCLRLYKEGNYYRLYISTRLTYTETDKKNHSKDYTEITNNALKMLCSVVSSESETLYKAIFSEWEGNNDYNINQSSFVTVGDCKVKYVNGDGHGEYLIKAK